MLYLWSFVRCTRFVCLSAHSVQQSVHNSLDLRKVLAHTYFCSESFGVSVGLFGMCFQHVYRTFLPLASHHIQSAAVEIFCILFSMESTVRPPVHLGYNHVQVFQCPLPPSCVLLAAAFRLPREIEIVQRLTLHLLFI